MYTVESLDNAMISIIGKDPLETRKSAGLSKVVILTEICNFCFAMNKTGENVDILREAMKDIWSCGTFNFKK